MEQSVNQRIKLLINELGLTVNAFANKTGVSQKALSNMFLRGTEPSSKTISSICKMVDHINKEWLLTGEGQMFTDTKNESDKKKDIPILDSDYRLVPIIHIDSVGGIHSSNEIVGETEYIEGHVPFVGAREDDRAIYQSGESMIPTIPPGSLMQIREVVGWREYFGYGDIFVLLLTDGRRITKEITKYDANPKDYVWCVSHNPNVPDEELPRSMIVRVWKVIKVLTDKGW